MRPVHCLYALALATLTAPVSAATADTAIQVVSGLVAPIAKVRVEIVDGIAAINADEKWEIVGSCIEEEGVSMAFVTGVQAIGADIKVEIVEGASAMSADRRVCITNPQKLDASAAKLLKPTDR